MPVRFAFFSVIRNTFNLLWVFFLNSGSPFDSRLLAVVKLSAARVCTTLIYTVIINSSMQIYQKNSVTLHSGQVEVGQSKMMILCISRRYFSKSFDTPACIHIAHQPTWMHAYIHAHRHIHACIHTDTPHSQTHTHTNTHTHTLWTDTQSGCTWALLFTLPDQQETRLHVHAGKQHHVHKISTMWTSVPALVQYTPFTKKVIMALKYKDNCHRLEEFI